MLKAGAFVAVLPALVLCATLGRLGADEDAPVYRLPKGTKAIALHLSKGEEYPEGAEARSKVDIVCENSEPVKTGISLVNVRLLVLDCQHGGDEPKELVVVVELTEAQMDVLALMQKHGTKLSMRLHDKGKPKP
jgi:hypothetical protein